MDIDSVLCLTTNSKTDWMVMFYYYNIMKLSADSVLIDCSKNSEYLDGK